MVIVTLTKTQEDGRMAIERSHGPLRQLQEDIHNLTRSLHRLREEVQVLQGRVNPPYGGPGNPWGANPNSPYTLTGGAGQPTVSITAPSTKGLFDV